MLLHIATAIHATVIATALTSRDYGAASFQAHTWSVPVLVGETNASIPGSASKFWFPSISIPTGLAGHVAQHVTLAGDGGTCPSPGHAPYCEQVMLTVDGGKTYFVVKKVAKGTSGNFNGYNDLGTWVPNAGSEDTPGQFNTIVACNDCLVPGGSVDQPAFLQTWIDTGRTLALVANKSATFSGTPDSFRVNTSTWLASPSQTIVRTADGELLLAMYGHAADSGQACGSRGCYSTVFFKSKNNGLEWQYTSRIDQTSAMPFPSEGPCEPSIVVLDDGTVLSVFRLDGGVQLWGARSHDNGATWDPPAGLVACPGVEKNPYGVWPQLLKSNGQIVLVSGRPGIGLWTADASGKCWGSYTDVIAVHNATLPDDPFTTGTETTSYTGVAELSSGQLLVAYDKIGAGRVGNVQKIYSMSVNLSKL